MKLRLLYLVVLGIFAVILTVKTNARSTEEMKVQSYNLEEIEEFNRELIAKSSQDSHGDWQSQPLKIALKYLQGAGYSEYSSIESKISEGEDPEFPNTVTITAIQDGFRDDSVRGKWTQIILKRDRSGLLLLQEVRGANRCWRGVNTEAFQQELCP